MIDIGVAIDLIEAGMAGMDSGIMAGMAGMDSGIMANGIVMMDMENGSR